MKITVNVADKHIDAPLGPARYCSCPIAKALKEAGYTDVSVGLHHCYLHAEGKDYYAEMPAAAEAFIISWDAWDMGGRYDERPEPISFDLEMEPAVINH